jgi:formylmethanofuran dehydrogenase subunit D
MGIDVGKFLKTPEFDITITTFRDVFQNADLETGNIKGYAEKSATIYLPEKKMKGMNLGEESHVKITTSVASIVVKVRQSDDVDGVASMFNSPWSNALISNETPIVGVPNYKHIKAKISLTKEPLTTLKELIYNKK